MELLLEHITFGYDKLREALDDVNGAFGQGIHLVLGPNGSGKTTLLKVIAGLLCPQKGECVYGKEATFRHPPHAIKEIFLLTDECQFPLPTVNDMVRLHAPFYSGFSEKFLREALEMFGMRGDERLAELSLGNRHKAQTAYALALGTKVLLLDEPANGLDISSKKALTHILGRAMEADEERCIVVATHTVQEMRNLFDSVTILNHGRVTLNVSVGLLEDRLSFISDGWRHEDALCFDLSIDGPTQIVPKRDGKETSVDFPLLFLAAVGPHSDRLKTLLS